VVRQSPEKDTLRFVRFCKVFSKILREQGYVPLLAGAASDVEYATRVKKEMREACSHAIIIDSFLSPQELAAIFDHTVLNFHPCAYEAYGMTVVEAAAMGVPSVVAGNGQVGATAILKDASIHVNMTSGCDISEAAVPVIAKWLLDPEGLRCLGVKARERALAWDEFVFGETLLDSVCKLCI
jgi:glycosyltransferase involved in cell wall biosynthesis